MLLAKLPLDQTGRLIAMLLLVIALAIALPDTTAATSINEIKKLLASDGIRDDNFGYSVAVSGNTAVIGAISDDPTPLHKLDDYGAAYIFERDEGGANNWGEVTKLTASDASRGDLLGISSAIDGDTIVVGITGAAYVFERDQGGINNWGEVKKLRASGGGLGRSVAISGDIVSVGAPFENAGGGSSSGAAYVFGRNQGGVDNWGNVASITASDAEASDQLGFSMSVSGDTLIVGAFGEDAGGDSAGAAYIYQADQGGADNWGEVKKLTASDAEAGGGFGLSVAVSDDTVIATASGAGYVFTRDEGGPNNWGEVKKLTAAGAEAGALGRGVALSGDTAVLGAWFDDKAASDAGAVYVFRRDEGGPSNWGEVTSLTASDAQPGAGLGFGVAISGDVVVAGAWHIEAAYVFDLLLPKPTATNTPPPSVGGVSLDSGLQPLQLEAASPDSSHWATIAAFAAAAGLLGLGGGAWYMKRRIPAKY